MKIRLFALIIFLLLPGFTWKLENDLEQVVHYTIYWEDHKLENYPFPFEIAGGELKGNKDRLLETDWPAGIYIVHWSDPDNNWTYSDRIDCRALAGSESDMLITVRLKPIGLTIEVR